MTEQTAELDGYKPTNTAIYILLAWLWVGLPFGYGAYQLLLKVGQLFG